MGGSVGGRLGLCDGSVGRGALMGKWISFCWLVSAERKGRKEREMRYGVSRVCVYGERESIEKVDMI